MKIKAFPYSIVNLAIKKLGEFIMPLDINKYRKYLDEFDLTEEQKVKSLQTVWSIMESFVDKAFGLNPVQQCLKPSPEKYLQSLKGNVESKPSTYSRDNATDYFKQLH